MDKNTLKETLDLHKLWLQGDPNGNAQCESCNWHGPYKYCFVNTEIELLESRIKELEAENKRLQDALREITICSSRDSASYIAAKALNPPKE